MIKNPYPQDADYLQSLGNEAPIPLQIEAPKTDEEIKKEWSDFIVANMPGKGLMKDWLDHITQNRSKPVSTGFPGLDRFLGGGLRPGLYYIGGNPGSGKTTLIQNLLLHISSERPTIFFSLEMNRYSIMSRFVSACSFLDDDGRIRSFDSGIHCSEFNTGIGGKNNDFLSKLNFARRRFENKAKSLIILDHDSIAKFAGMPDKYITMGAIRQIIEAVKDHFGIAPIVAVDYLQIIPENYTEHKELRDLIITNCRIFQALRNEHDLTLLILYQYSRSGMQARPELTSGAESSEIEKSAEMVLALFDPSKTKPTVKPGRPTKEEQQEKIRQEKEKQDQKFKPDDFIPIEIHKLKARDCPNLDPILLMRHYPLKSLFAE